MPDVNIHLKTQGAQQAQQALNQTAGAAKGVGEKTATAGKEGAGGMNLLSTATQALKGYLVGLVGISGLFAFFSKWLTYIKEINEAQKELVNSTKSLDQAAKAYAGQANLLGTPGGTEAARKQILEIQKKGNLGSFELAEGIAVSAHGNIGESGQLLTESQMEIAGEVGGFAQRKNISPTGVDRLFKVLAAMDVSGEEETKLRIQQLSTVQQKSRAKNFEQFMPGAIKSLIPQLGHGATPEMAMAQYASALDTAASPDLAAEKTKQVSAMMLRPKVAEAIGGGFAKKTYDQKLDAFGRFAASSSDPQLLDAGLSVEQVGTLSTLYTPKQLGRIQMFRGLAGGTTAAQFTDEAAGYAETAQGQIESIEAEGLRTGASATQEERIGQALIDAGDKQWKKMQARDETSFLTPDSIEKPLKTAWLPLKKRALQLREAQQKGKVPEKSHEDITELMEFLTQIIPTVVNPLTAAEVGKAEGMLKKLEPQIINNYSNDLNLYPTAGSDPAHRNPGQTRTGEL